MDKREKKTLFMYLGIGMKHPYSIKEISKLIEIEEESIEQIINTTIDNVIKKVNKINKISK